MKKKLLLCTLFSSMLLLRPLHAQVVTTLAGSGSTGSANGTGTAASFNFPKGLATDSFGNVYVADQGNHLIRKITPDGVVSTVAGSGHAGSSDDFGTDASFSSPADVALDKAGNIYVADEGNFLVRKIFMPSGYVYTLAGTGSLGSANGYGTAASFAGPSGIDVDDLGNVYVADPSNFQVRKITPGGLVSTFKTYSFSGNWSIAVDKSGNVYVSDVYAYQILKITPSGMVSTLAGSGSEGSADGTGTAASFNLIYEIALDTAGNLMVADAWNSLIRKVTPQGVVTTIETSVSFNTPESITVDKSGNIYVGDFSNVYKITPSTVTANVEHVASVSAMSFYPIPAKHYITLSVDLKNDSHLKWELINPAGIKVASAEANYGAGSIELTLPVETLPAGIYVAHVYTNDQMTSQKVVIEK